MQIISNKKWAGLQDRLANVEGLQHEIKSIQSANIVEQFSSISATIFPSWNIFKEIELYRINDDINAVVSKLAVNSATIPFYGYDAKSGEDLLPEDPLSILLSKLDFTEKEILYTHFYLFGEVFLYKNKVELGPNAGVLSTDFLHPNFMQLVLTTGFPTEIAGYIYRDPERGIQLNFLPDEIIFIRTVNPATNFYERWRGVSKASVLAQTLTRLKAGRDASVGQLQNGGGKSIVFQEASDFEAIEKTGMRKENYSKFTRNPDNVGAPYFAGGGKMGILRLNDSLVDLDIKALAQWDFDKICNVFGVSSILFNNKGASTESNVQEMKKEMYTNTILPNIYRVEGALNKYLVPDVKTKGVVKCDVSEIKELHEDTTRQAAALAQMWWLTGNEKRETMMYGEDVDDELMNKYIIPAGMVLLDDLGQTAGFNVPPINPTTFPTAQ